MKRILKTKKKGFMLPLTLISIFCILLVLLFVISRYAINEELNTIKNAADYANLATYKNINQKILSETGNITFQDDDTNDVYLTFSEYLADNLKLSSSLNPGENDYIVDTVKINKINIYTVTNEGTTEWTFNPGSRDFTKIYDNTPLQLKTPTNKKVNKTSVYTEIIVPIKIPLIGERDITVPSYTDVVN